MRNNVKTGPQAQGSCGRKEINRKNRESLNMCACVTERTLVIDGVTDGKDSKDGGKDRSSGRVLSAEVLGLQPSEACLRSWSLGEFRVEVYEGSEASSRSSGLYRLNRSRKKDTCGQCRGTLGRQRIS